MRLSRIRIVSAALLPLVFLAACTSAKNDAPTPGGLNVNGLDTITVGGTSQIPTVTFKAKPVSVTETTTKVVTPGRGAKLSRSNKIVMAFALFNGKTGKQISNSFGRDKVLTDLASTTLTPGLIKGLIGQQVGSRVLIGIPPADAFGAKGNAQAGIGPTDTLVYFVHIQSSSTPLAVAGGIAVPPKAGLPTAIVPGAEPAQITVPKTAAPTKLVVQLLIKGAGAVVARGQSIRINYTGVRWSDGVKFDASGDNGGPVDVQIGEGKVMPGWEKGLLGQTVGSRILLVVPPALGYGAAGKPPTISATDTMVFVVDILNVN